MISNRLMQKCRIHAADVLRNLHVITTRGGLLAAMEASRCRQDDRNSLNWTSSARRSLSAEIPVGSTNQQLLSSLQTDFGAQKPVSQSDGHGISTRTALKLLSMYLAAVIHDYDHRGVTNAFLIQDEDPLAVS